MIGILTLISKLVIEQNFKYKNGNILILIVDQCWDTI